MGKKRQLVCEGERQVGFGVHAVERTCVQVEAWLGVKDKTWLVGKQTVRMHDIYGVHASERSCMT